MVGWDRKERDDQIREDDEMLHGTMSAIKIEGVKWN